MRQCSIRSTHWSGHPERRTPPQAATASSCSPRLDWEDPESHPTRSPESPQHPSSDSDRNAGRRCRPTRRVAMQRWGADTQRRRHQVCTATRTRVRMQRTVGRVNRVADATPLQRRRAPAHCNQADAALHAMRMTQVVHTRKVEAAHPVTRSESGQVDPVARSSAKTVAALAPGVGDDPVAPESPRRPDLSRFTSTLPANAASSVSTGGAAHSGHQFKSPDGMRSAGSPYGLRRRRYTHFVLTAVAALDDGVTAVDRAISRVRSRQMPLRPHSGSGRAPGRISARVDTR